VTVQGITPTNDIVIGSTDAASISGQ